MLKKAVTYSLAVAGFLWVALFCACEKDITVDLPEPDEVIVVEGYIFEGQRPWVFLSHNSPFFAPVDSEAVYNTFITDALVTVSDGINTDTLTFQTANETPLKLAYVKNNGLVKGVAGRNYTLTIVSGGKTLTSTTSIIPSVPIDSTRWKVYQDPGDTLGLVWMYFKDPGTDERAYRIFSRRTSQIKGRNQRIFRPNTLLNNQQFYGQPYMFGVGLGDKYADGLSEDKFDHADRKRYRVGDTVKIRLCACDLVTYNFVRVLEQSMDDADSPFASPNNVPTNINGGLGCWQGYGVSEVQVVCWP